MSEVYVSIDVETDGPIPGDYSMMSLGAAAFSDQGHLVDAFSANLLPLKGAKQDPDTMKWWENQPKAWEAVMKDRKDPEGIVKNFVGWVRNLDGTPVAVAYPSGFDFTFVYWYVIHFGCKSPFSFSCLDVKSYAATKLNKPYRSAGKGSWPKAWRRAGLTIGASHSHVAIEDAIERGAQFMAMLSKDSTTPQT